MVIYSTTTIVYSRYNILMCEFVLHMYLLLFKVFVFKPYRHLKFCGVDGR